MLNVKKKLQRLLEVYFITFPMLCFKSHYFFVSFPNLAPSFPLLTLLWFRLWSWLGTSPIMSWEIIHLSWDSCLLWIKSNLWVRIYYSLTSLSLLKFLFQEKYPPLVLKVKWPEAIYKVVQYYKQCCEAVPNNPSQSL